MLTMKEQQIVQSPTFEVNLGGIDLNEAQAKELEKAIQQTTMQFLAKLDNGYLKNVFELIPEPEADGDPKRQPNLLLDRKWWFGQKLLRLRDNQRVTSEMLGKISDSGISQVLLVKELKSLS
jgi:hypothetical protein